MKLLATSEEGYLAKDSGFNGVEKTSSRTAGVVISSIEAEVELSARRDKVDDSICFLCSLLLLLDVLCMDGSS